MITFNQITLNGWIKSTLILCLSFIPITGIAQHNGDPLLFQGLSTPNDISVKGAAYGNAFVSRKGDLNSLFYNVAGLSDINKMQVSFGTNYKTSLVRDNANFYPGNDYLNWSLYMEHLIEPDPAWDGIWSTILGTMHYDSLGNPIGQYWDPAKIKRPLQGADDYSKEAADHEKQFNRFGLDHISAAYPFELFDKKFVAAVSYNKQFDVNDYDWNGSHLDPHWGTSDIIIAEPGDTTITNWSIFTRKRSGGIYSVSAALALKFDENIRFGIKLNRIAGTTDDEQSLDRIGYFETIHQGNNWAFTHDYNLKKTVGTSSFSAFNLSMGGLYVTDNFNVGFNIQLPYTLERDWEYVTSVSDNDGTVSSNTTGIDEVDMPTSFSLGITFKPTKEILISVDFQSTNYSNAEYNLSTANTDTVSFYNSWVKQSALNFGIEYKVSEYLAFLGGYQSKTIPFVPYGNAIRDEGPASEIYSFGASISLGIGVFDVAYTYSQLKYYDVYVNNRNFTLEQYNRFLFAYTLEL